MTSYIEHNLKGKLIRIPQTDYCTQCHKAYAEHEDFICNGCCQHLSNEDWNKLRIMALREFDIPTGESEERVKPL